MFTVWVVAQVDVHGWVIKIVELESLAPHCLWFVSCQGHWIYSYEEASYGTLMVGS